MSVCSSVSTIIAVLNYLLFSVSTLHAPYIVSASTLVRQDALRESLALLAAPCFKPTPTPMTAREISKLLTTHSHHHNQVRLMSEDSSVLQTALVNDLPTPDSGKDALIRSRWQALRRSSPYNDKENPRDWYKGSTAAFSFHESTIPECLHVAQGL